VFFSPRAYRALPKSPIELVVGTLRFAGAPHVPANVLDALRRMGQEPLNPPSVKGWDGGPAWINTNALLARFNFVNAFVATSGKNGLAPSLAPDTIVADAGGMDAERIVATLVTRTLQDDVTSETRAALLDYLESRADGAAALPFSAENYQDKIRGAVALTLNLPVNQLN
jgi:uncharacterized protein (DUF1800 family)